MVAKAGLCVLDRTGAESYPQPPSPDTRWQAPRSVRARTRGTAASSESFARWLMVDGATLLSPWRGDRIREVAVVAVFGGYRLRWRVGVCDEFLTEVTTWMEWDAAVQ